MREHARVLTELGAQVALVRRPGELVGLDGLVLPGGESTVIDKLSRAFGIQGPLRDVIAGGLPVLGTCAGLILLANRLADGIAGQETFGGLDATVRRNAFGGQVESFETELEVPALGPPTIRAAFIPGPGDRGARPLGDSTRLPPCGPVVAAEQDGLLGIAFHPESTGETRFHQRFLDRIRGA